MSWRHGGVQPGHVAIERGPRGLVEGGPEADAVPEAGKAGAGVLQVSLHGGRVLPPSLLRQSGREVPVVQGDVGRDALCEEGVDQAVVEGQAGLVPVPVALGVDSWP